MELWPNIEHVHPCVSLGRWMVVSLLWAGSLLPSSLVPSKATAWGQPVLDAATSQMRLTWPNPAWCVCLGEWKNPQPYQNNSGR